MENSQMVNLVNFTFLCKDGTDAGFLSSPDYILEKYDKMIGFDPTEKVKELSEESEDLKSKWMDKWNIEDLSPKEESILNYLCDINTERIEDVYEVMKLFRHHIGDIRNIKTEQYGHLHTNFKRFVNSYISNDNDNNRKHGLKFIDNF